LSSGGIEEASGQQNAGKDRSREESPEHERSFAKGKVGTTNLYCHAAATCRSSAHGGGNQLDISHVTEDSW
jgi:hypothetical protein